MQERTILINGVSKSHSMTGWRLGYCSSHRNCKTHHQNPKPIHPYTPSNIAQYAAIEALNNLDFVHSTKNAFLKTLSIDPDFAPFKHSNRHPTREPFTYLQASKNYTENKVHLVTISNSSDFCKYLLEEEAWPLCPDLPLETIRAYDSLMQPVKKHSKSMRSL